MKFLLTESQHILFPQSLRLGHEFEAWGQGLSFEVWADDNKNFIEQHHYEKGFDIKFGGQQIAEDSGVYIASLMNKSSKKNLLSKNDHIKNQVIRYPFSYVIKPQLLQRCIIYLDRINILLHFINILLHFVNILLHFINIFIKMTERCPFFLSLSSGGVHREVIVITLIFCIYIWMRLTVFLTPSILATTSLSP